MDGGHKICRLEVSLHCGSHRNYLALFRRTDQLDLQQHLTFLHGCSRDHKTFSAGTSKPSLSESTATRKMTPGYRITAEREQELSSHRQVSRLPLGPCG